MSLLISTADCPRLDLHFEGFIPSWFTTSLERLLEFDFHVVKRLNQPNTKCEKLHE